MRAGLACGPLLAVVLLGGCGSGDRGDDQAATPQSVAQQWATDVLMHSGSGADALECRPGLEDRLVPIRMAAAAISSVRATGVTGSEAAGWQVSLVTEPGDATTFEVSVVRRNGSLLVCD
ncbi:MAG TPA: hypothetical protein VN088_16585 [Nocardioides sp.]|nr:hypothetical protein [Nocardioides sp.]